MVDTKLPRLSYAGSFCYFPINLISVHLPAFSSSFYNLYEHFYIHIFLRVLPFTTHLDSCGFCLRRIAEFIAIILFIVCCEVGAHEKITRLAISKEPTTGTMEGANGRGNSN